MHLRPVLQSDIYDFARTTALAMQHDEAKAYFAPHKSQYPDSYFAYELLRAKQKFYTENNLFFCVTDASDHDYTGTETIMGCCSFASNIPPPTPLPSGVLGNTFEQYALKLQSWYSRYFTDKSIDWNALDHFRTGIMDPAHFNGYLKTLPEKYQQPGNDGRPRVWETWLLATLPEFRRRGVGKKMLEWAWQRAEEDDVPLVLVATTAGKKLYPNVGFQQVGEVRFVPEQLVGEKYEETRERLRSIGERWGMGEGIIWSVMAWEPAALKAAREEI